MSILNRTQLGDYVKANGITLFKTLGRYCSVPKGTKLYFGCNDDEIASTCNSKTNDLNKQFMYSFDYQLSFTDSTVCDFELIEPNKTLIEQKMELDEIKEFSPKVLADAEKEAKKQLAEEQTNIAVAKFKELLMQIDSAERDVVRAQKRLDDLRGKAAAIKPAK